MVSSPTAAAPARPDVLDLPYTEADLNGSMADRFRRVARWRPDHPAIQDLDQVFTYAALDALSDQVAAGLAPYLDEPGARVPVLFAPGQAAALVAVLGVLKAGGAFTGLDPAHPLERSRIVCADAQPVAVLTDRRHAALAHDIAQAPVLVLEDLLSAPPASAPQRAIAPEQIAMLLYTSGTSGQPKGIARTHGDGVQRGLVTRRNGTYTPDDRVLVVHFIAYAAATGYVFGTLLNGGTIYTLDPRQLSVPELVALFEREAFTYLPLPTALFRHLVAQLEGRLALPRLRKLSLAGEALLKSDVEAFRRCFPLPVKLVHNFATSETGVITRISIDHQTPLTSPRVTVGWPPPGVELFFWDEHGQPVPPGEVGEIVVYTPLMSLGYWRNPPLKRPVFVPDPDNAKRLLYRTGDLGRLLPDGSLMHLGRLDEMVKIRGYRVEPMEVELALQQVNARQQVAVVPRERRPGEQELVAFVVAPAGEAFAPAALRRGLAAVLPDHMLPARFVQLDQWPLTASAKIDRQALRSLALPPAAPAETYTAPRDDLERTLAGLWEAALDVRPIGIHDHFFDLGGHSLLALDLLARIAQATGQRLRVTALFQAPTVARLAAFMRGEGNARPLPEALALLQPRGAGRPLFLIPELEASAMTLVKVVRYLGAARPVYGLQPRGYADGHRPFGSVPATAAYYVSAVRAVQPHGPYLLAGLCYGGLVAFEMARQLTGQGETVQVLAGVDVPPMRPLAATRLARVRRRLNDVRRRWQLWKEARVERSLAVLSRWKLYPAEKLDPDSLRPVRYLRHAQRQASVPYSPGPYAGSVSLLLSQEVYERGRLTGWQVVARGGVDMEVAAGVKHAPFLAEDPHLRTIAAWLAARLERADPVPAAAREIDPA